MPPSETTATNIAPIIPQERGSLLLATWSTYAGAITDDSLLALSLAGDAPDVANGIGVIEHGPAQWLGLIFVGSDSDGETINFRAWGQRKFGRPGNGADVYIPQLHARGQATLGTKSGLASSIVPAASPLGTGTVRFADTISLDVDGDWSPYPGAEVFQKTTPGNEIAFLEIPLRGCVQTILQLSLGTASAANAMWYTF